MYFHCPYISHAWIIPVFLHAAEYLCTQLQAFVHALQALMHAAACIRTKLDMHAAESARAASIYARG